jgi:hypothetical protein
MRGLPSSTSWRACRHDDWNGERFTSESRSHISVWESLVEVDHPATIVDRRQSHQVRYAPARTNALLFGRIRARQQHQSSEG